MTQKMCDEAADDSIATLKVIPDWFVTSNMTVCFYHVTYEFEIESTLYSCLNVKELLARSRRHI